MIDSLISKYEAKKVALNKQLEFCTDIQALTIQQQLIDIELFIYDLKLIKEHV